jgi:hypothetical protein
VTYQTSIPSWMAYKRQLLIHPSYDVVSQDYQRFRIPRPPEQTEAGSVPGQICWGTVGPMPQAVPMPGVDFNVQTERSRKSQPVRIENPDDPEQYVIADRATEITFDGKVNAAPPGPNTHNSQSTPGMSDYDPDVAAGFKPAGGPRPGMSDYGVSTTFKYASTP